jgi:hypothetical protein
LAVRQGQAAAARVRLREALETARAIQATPLLLRALTPAASLLAASGQQARAAEVLACILHHPASERQTRERAERAWIEAAQQLPEAVLATAQARGRQFEPAVVAGEVAEELGRLKGGGHASR